MKKLFTSLLLCILSISYVSAQSHFENFDSYTVGDYLGKSSSYWETWTNNPGSSEDVRVTNTDAYSGSKSIYMGAGATKEDIVLLFNKKKKLTKGLFILKQQMKIPSGSSGYLNLQGDTFFGTGGTWTTEIKFSTTGGLTFTGMSPAFSGTYPQGKWFEFKLVINLSQNIWDIYIDNILISSHSNSTNVITGMNVYGDVSTNSYWLDDIYFAHYMPGPDDAGVLSIDSPAVHCAGNPRNIYATIGNFGKNQIKKVTINWSVNGKTQTAVSYTGTLDTMNGAGSTKARVKLGSHTFKSTADTIKVWTSDPNGNKDTLNFFDTMLVIRKPVPPPTANAGGSIKQVCKGSSVKIGSTAVTGNRYSWTSNPSGFTSTAFNPNVSPTVNTWYKLRVTNNSTGCFSEDSVFVKVMDIPVAQVDSAKVICAGDSVLIGTSYKDPFLRYSWSSSPGNFTSYLNEVYVKPSATTKYTLIVLDTGGCTNKYVVDVTVNPLPVASAGSDKSICKGESVQIGWPATAGHTYSWRSIPAGFSSSAANPTVTPAADSTVYIVTVTNQNGCINRDEVVVKTNPLPVANAGRDTAVCLGGSARIGEVSKTGQFYTWTSSPAGFSDFSANPLVTPKVTTTYKVSVRNTNGCIHTDSVKVTVAPQPVANAGTPKSVCIGESTSIGSAAETGITYSWTSTPAGFTSASATVNVSPTETTTYKVTATNATGCSSESQVVVTVNQLPVANAGNEKTVCPGEPVKIGTVQAAGITYKWTSVPTGFTSTEADPTVSPSETTTYKLEVSNANGCKATSEVKINVGMPSAAYTVTKKGLSATFVAEDTTLTKYDWNFRDGNTGSGARITHTFPAAGTYKVKLTVTKIEGCTSTSETEVEIGNVGITPDVTRVKNVNVFPNPFTSSTTLCYSLEKRAQVRISLLDITGKQVAELANNMLPGGDYTQQINAANYKLTPGIYFIQLQVDGNGTTRKILKIE